MKKNPWLVVVSLPIVLSLLVGPALAAPPQRAPLAVEGLAQGDDFLISRAEGYQRESPAVAYNDDLGEYLVVWMDERVISGYWDIYGQIVSSGGQPRGDNFVIRDEATSGLTLPDVAYDTTNQRYLVVWYDVTEVDVEGQLLNSDGSAFGAAINIAEGTPSDIRGFPSVAFHPFNDEYLVAYVGGPYGDYNIYGRRVTAAGIVGATEYAISTAAADDQTVPDVSVDPSATGSFLIVWQDERSGKDEIWGTLMYSAWFLSPERLIMSWVDMPVREPAAAFNPAAGVAGEWLVVFQRDAWGDNQITAQRVTAAGIPAGVVLVCDDDEDQMHPQVAYNAYGNDQWLVVWEDNRADVTNHDVYGRRVDVNASTLGDTFIISNPPDNQLAPAVASSSTNQGYLVVFSDARTIDVLGQRVLTSGLLVGPALTVSAPVGDQQQAVVAYNSQDGEYLVVWQDRRAGNWDIYGQRVDLDGTLLGYTLAICTDTSAQLNPAVAYNPDTNQYLVVWDDRRNAEADLYGQLLDANGGLNGGNVVIADAGATGRHVPRLAYNLISGEYLVVYGYEAENNNIRGRRLDASGVPLAPELEIATGATDQNFPDVACRTMEPGGGGYLVVWRDTDGAQRDVKGQRLNQFGGLLGGLDLCTQLNSQWSPAVAYSPQDDRYLVVWPDDRDAATQGRNVYGRQVSGGGALQPEFAISTASGNQAPVAVTYGSGPSHFVVAWEDSRNASTTPDLYGQRVSGSGIPVGTPIGSNDLLYTGPGGQESPVVAWAGDEMQGLLAWSDYRNGLSYDIYGRCLAVALHPVFMPLVLKNK